MKLEDWLEKRAGLTGKKLDAARHACDTALAETVTDLRRLVSDEKNFILAFPAAVVRSEISRALDNDADHAEENEKRTETEQRTKEAESVDLATTAQHQLPNGKRCVVFSDVCPEHFD